MSKDVTEPGTKLNGGVLKPTFVLVNILQLAMMLGAGCAPLVLDATVDDDREIRTEGERMILDFKNTQNAAEWLAVNDGVMGGLSDGQVRISEDGTLTFFGEVSLKNNGGFASIRSRPLKRDLSQFDGLVIRVRGDGKRYALTLRTNVPITAGSYRVKFDTKPAEWQEIRLPFADFEATSFGRVINSVPALDPGQIRSFGFLISDKQEGPFRLEVDWIKAFGQPDNRDTSREAPESPKAR